MLTFRWERPAGRKCDHKILIDGVEKLWDQGLVVVAAAGNQGPRPGSVTAPGSSRKIITVGSSDLLTGRSAISGRGLRLNAYVNLTWWHRAAKYVPAPLEWTFLMGSKAAHLCLHRWFPVQQH